MTWGQQMFVKKHSHVSTTLTCHKEWLDKRPPMQPATPGQVSLMVTSPKQLLNTVSSCLSFLFLNTVNITPGPVMPRGTSQGGTGHMTACDYTFRSIFIIHTYTY